MSQEEIMRHFAEAFPAANVEVYDYWPDEVPHLIGVSCAFPYVVVSRDYFDAPMKKQSKQEFARDNLASANAWRRAVRVAADKPDIDAAIAEIKQAMPVAQEQFGIRIVC